MIYDKDYLVFDKHTYEILYQVVKVKTRKHKKGYRMKRTPYYQNTYSFSVDQGKCEDMTAYTHFDKHDKITEIEYD